MVDVNWHEYFREFCKIHGNFPVIWKADPRTGRGGWFLFPDGWLYGRMPSGPEIRPQSTRAQLYLILQYWQTRKKILGEEIRLREDELRNLARLQSQRSGRVIVDRISRERDENGKVVSATRVREPIDFDVLLANIRQLKIQEAECDRGLESPELSVQSLGVQFNESEVVAELEEILNGSPDREPREVPEL